MNWKVVMEEAETCILCAEPFKGTMSWAVFWGMTTGSNVCERCREKFELIHKKKSCNGCSKPHSSEEHWLCDDCTRWQKDPFWSEYPFLNRSLYSYTSFLKEMMARFKYRGDAFIAGV
ncbi:hypothetical protein [Alteribacter populi]|uniref:hypothetical protein n=1 Tax=Alteribacter populi TaxID=2011011 RepID=UPI000BBACF0A|nr:hypothetical protein [Alteribacter populi]